MAELTIDFESTTGIPCSLTVTGTSRALAPDAGLALYRVAQEALTNAAKHASPDSVRVELGYGPEHTTLRVEDRAERCPEALARHGPPHGSGPGYGLNGMRERAELLGGSLAAWATGHGFAVELTVPG